MELLSELTQALEATLPATSRTARQVAAQSAAGLGAGSVSAPYWLGVRRLQFRWRARLADEGGETRFLFIRTGVRSAREQLDSNVVLDVRPVPELEGRGLSETAELPSAVEMPHAYVPQAGALEFRFNGERRLFARLTDPTVGVHEEDVPRNIELERLPQKDWLRAGEKIPWPLDSFVEFALAMAAEPVTGGGGAYKLRTVASPPKVTRKLRVRDFVAELTRRLRPAPALVALGDPDDAGSPALPIPLRWRLTSGGATLGVLVDQDGFIGQTRDEDTFLCPVEITFVRKEPGWGMALATGWPDFVLRGEIREAVLSEFVRKANWEELARTEPLRGLGCTGDFLRNWLEDEQKTVLVRVDRRSDDEDVVLFVTGEVGGREVVVMLYADEVSYNVNRETGQVAAEVSDPQTLHVNILSGASMPWKRGKQLFCDVLHGFLRWDAFVAPLLELP